MDETNARRIRAALTGVEAGVMGALAIVLFMTIVSLAQGSPWWAYPNVLATCLYGGRALHAGAGWKTVFGVALQVLDSGIAGVIFCVLTLAVTGRFRMTLLGLAWGLVWFYSMMWLAGRFARLIPVYAPEIPLLSAHLMLGLILGRSGQRLTVPTETAPVIR